MAQRLWIACLGIVLLASACTLPAQPSATATPEPSPVPAPAAVVVELATPEPVAFVAAGRPPEPVETPPAVRPRVIVLDPGHLPSTVGALSADGSLAEQALSLNVAQRLERLLKQQGFVVHSTRPDGLLALTGSDPGLAASDAEFFRPRIGLANEMGADVLVSLHFNGAADTNLSGTTVYYAGSGPYQAESKRLAVIMQGELLAALHSNGYRAPDWGARSDEGLKSYGTLYSLGQNPILEEKGRWPAVLIEPLFLTNTLDASFLKRPHALDVIAQGVMQAICGYFEQACTGVQLETEAQ